MDLFGETGTYEADASGATVLLPIWEFPPIHYRRVQENGTVIAIKDDRIVVSFGKAENTFLLVPTSV